MLFTTTPIIEGRPIKEYLGVVSCEVILGANVIKDFMAGMRDIFGGRSGAYEKTIAKAKDNAMSELEKKATRMGANAVVGIDIDYETIGSGNSMLMVAVSGTAVVV